MMKVTSTILGLTLVAAVSASDVQAEELRQTAFFGLFNSPFTSARTTPSRTNYSAYNGGAPTYGTSGSSCSSCAHGRCGTGYGNQQPVGYRPYVATYRPTSVNYQRPYNQYQAPTQYPAVPTSTHYAPAKSNSPYFGGY